MKLINKCRAAADKAAASRWFIPAQAAVAAAAMFAGQGIIGAGLMVALMTALLLFSDDTFAALCPLLFAVMSVTEYYNNYYELAPYAIALAPAGAALIVNLIVYHGKPVKGRFTLSLAAVSAALLLGGLGMISKDEYFAGITLYYVIGLGAALLMFYVLLRSRLSRTRGYDAADRFAQLLYAMALLAIVPVVQYYAAHWQELAADFHTPFIGYRNFCTTVMLFGMPMTCYFVRRSRWHLLGCLAVYAAMLIAGSRSGLLFGTIELALCMVYVYVQNPQSRKAFRRIALIFALPAAALCAVLVYYLFLGDGGRFSTYIIKPTEARTRFYPQGITDFLTRPVLGYGLGNTKNLSIYKGVSGSIVFYHNSVLQVLASLGVVGAAAYGWQFIERVKTLCNNKNAAGGAMAIAYLGVLLMSQTNPGLFCPLPTALLLVMMFAVLEVNEKASGQSALAAD